MKQAVVPTLAGQCREYKRRWLMLAIFVLCSCTNAMHWIQFSIISNIATRYFNVSSNAINWTAVIFGVSYVPFAFPASWLLDQYVGVALGFLIPPAVVKNHEELIDVGRDLRALCYGLAICPTMVLVLLLLFFQKEPPLPPSPAQATLRCHAPITDKSADRQTYLQSLKSLLTNRNFVLLLLSYGINAGVFYVVSTLLNQIVLLHFAGAEEDAGRIGLTVVLAGMMGSLLGGIILDRMHWFKQWALLVYLMSLVGVLAFMFTLKVGHIWASYLTGGLLGFFMIGYLGIGLEFAAELTYPVPEGTSSGVLNVSSEIFGITFTLIGGELLNAYGDMATILTLAGLLVVGLGMTTLINGTDLRRQAATAVLKNQTTCTNISGFIPSVTHNSVLFPTSLSGFPS
ncbi:feline leukemia virus subgroup C receptor-related protein 1 isoform X2 [Cryptotermes secundus]|uniref:feline leukemia virus subgroup C receptor-related protein 1 isoform X2 n=1 Tax=Cryptotermes secundus TaxID=105785 RepID=UPI000CD7C671|nr:feline leukemia virus subgroup C receptor-related protein 1 isoform X2 [Cryptotermes secundus]